MTTIIEDNQGNKVTVRGWSFAQSQSADVRAAMEIMFRNGAKFVALSSFGQLSIIIFP